MVMSPRDIPGTWKATVQIVEIASSLATVYVAEWHAPFRCTVTAMKIASTATVTGAGTNNVHLNVDGPSNTTEVGNLDFESGTDLVAGIASAMTMAADVEMAEDESLRLQQEEVGTGLGSAFSVGTWIIEYESR